MKIAIDLDGTIFSCDSLLYKVANTFFSAYSQQNLKYSEIDVEEEKTNSFLSRFTKILNHQYYKEVEDATNIIREWKRFGHEIILLSSRPNWKALRSVVLTWLDNFDLEFTMLVVACSNKAKFCEKYKVDVLIDDTFANCKNAGKQGIKSVCLVENKDKIKADTKNVFVAENWFEIDEQIKKIYNDKKQKVIKELEK